MGSFSIWHWLALAIYAVVFGVPAWQIFKRMGYHPAVSLVMWIPLINIVALWAVAFMKWPRDE